jgi:hypothetical protein
MTVLGVSIAVTMTIAPFMVAEGDRAESMSSLFSGTSRTIRNISLQRSNTYDRIDDVAPMDTDSVIRGCARTVEYRVSGRYISFTLTQDVLGGYFPPRSFIGVLEAGGADAT